MIIEITKITIKEDQNKAFEMAFEKAAQVFARAEGYLGHKLQRCIENNNQYVVLLKWNTVEDHTLKFQKSELFEELGFLIGKYFATAPIVEHYEIIQKF